MPGVIKSAMTIALSLLILSAWEFFRITWKTKGIFSPEWYYQPWTVWGLFLDSCFLFSVWFCCCSLTVFKQAGGCLSYNVHYGFMPEAASFTSFFLNMFILEKRRKKKVKFYCFICIFVCCKVYIILMCERLSCMSHSLHQFSSWLRLKWKWSATTSSLTPYERIRKPIYD